MESWIVLDVGLKLAVVTLSLVPLVRRDATHFTGKAMGIRAVVYPAMMLMIPGLWLLSGRPQPYPVAADVLVALPFLLDAAGNVFGWFALRHFDVLPHFLGWLAGSLAFGLAVAPLLDEHWIGFLLVLGFGAVTAILWEVAEYGMMVSGSSGLQLTYVNTVQDLAASLAGGAAAGLLLVTLFWPAAETPDTLFGWA